jgi:hypothetical protein
MAARQESKVTRLDLRIPNDIYAQVEEIAKTNSEPTHHITGNIILTPTLIKLIRLGIRSLSDNYPALADIPISSGQVSDNLLKRMDSIEGELSELKKLVAELSGNTVVAASIPDTIPDTSESDTVSDLVPDKISDELELASLPDNLSDAVPDNNEMTENHTIQSPSSESGTMAWTDFYRMIEEVLPQDLKRNKANSDHAIALAMNKGFDGWRYDSKVKNFIKP